MNCLVHPEALAELEEQAAWYEARRAGLGAELIREVRATLNVLVNQPLLGASVPLTDGARRLRLASYPLSIAYILESDNLLVLAFPHDKRRPSYWKGRG